MSSGSPVLNLVLKRMGCADHTKAVWYLKVSWSHLLIHHCGVGCISDQDGAEVQGVHVAVKLPRHRLLLEPRRQVPGIQLNNPHCYKPSWSEAGSFCLLCGLQIAR